MKKGIVHSEDDKDKVTSQRSGPYLVIFWRRLLLVCQANEIKLVWTDMLTYGCP